MNLGVKLLKYLHNRGYRVEIKMGLKVFTTIDGKDCTHSLIPHGTVVRIVSGGPGLFNDESIDMADPDSFDRIEEILNGKILNGDG